MSITLCTGQPGHGKSYRAVRAIHEALEAGQYVATNVPLTDGWALTMARANIFRRVSRKRCERVATEFERRMHFVDDLTLLRRLRIPACGTCKGCRKGPGCQREGRGWAILDEAHQWLNARTWDADETGQATTKAESVRRRLEIVKFFSTHRHFGWNIRLITQDENNLDRQVRGLFEYHEHLKNLRKFKPLGFPLLPFHFFVAVTTWHDNDKSRQGVQTYLLNKRLAGCYDTFGAARHLEDDPDAILLGSPSVPRREADRPASAGRPDAAPAAGRTAQKSPAHPPLSPPADRGGASLVAAPELSGPSERVA